MRNLLEYPITKQEIVDCLDDIIASLNYGNKNAESPIGDMRPLLLAKAKEIILREDSNAKDGSE